LMVSAARGINIAKLHKVLLDNFEKNFTELFLKVPIENSKGIAQIYELADVLNIKYEEDRVELHLRTSKQNEEKIRRLFK